MNIDLVGTGNVAVVLSQLLVKAGHSIKKVYGRNVEALELIAEMLNAKANTNLSYINTTADICLIAVSDAAIAPVASQILPTKTLVLHTSGATSISVLAHLENTGVLYPLQSLRKELPYLPKVPFFVQTNTAANLQTLQQLALSLSEDVKETNDEQRLKLHLAAVLCSNFSNHLYAVTQQFCKEEQLDFDSLLPLIHETTQRLAYFDAKPMQTGPAVRGDVLTINRHVSLLKNNPVLSRLYRQITESIQSFHSTAQLSEKRFLPFLISLDELVRLQ